MGSSGMAATMQIIVVRCHGGVHAAVRDGEKDKIFTPVAQAALVWL